MKRFLAGLIFLVAALPVAAQTGAVQDHCFLGGTKAVTSGLSSSNYLNGIIPSCTVTVYLTGTTTKATIYADGTGTPLANPFTAHTAASGDPGGWIFWANKNTGLDVVLSGGISPNTYPSPVTITGIFPSSSGGGGGGGALLYVTDYGADPTGVMDSTTAIQAACAAAQGGAGLVAFPQGTYKMNGGCTTTGNLFITAVGTATINQEDSSATTFYASGAQFMSIDGGSGRFIFNGGARVAHMDNADLEGAGAYFHRLTFVGQTSYPVDIEPTTTTPIVFTGNISVGSTTISSVSSTAGLVVSQPITGAGIPADAAVGYIGAGFITISLPATASASGVSISVHPTSSYTQLSQISTFDDIRWYSAALGIKALEDRTIIRNSWADWAPPSNNSAFIYNSAYGDPCASGHLAIDNSVFVPLTPSMTAVRWIDNYGSVAISHARMSSENGAYPTIYNFTQACTNATPVFTGVQVTVHDSDVWEGSAVDAGIVVIPPYGDVPNEIILDGVRGNYPYINNQAGSLVAGMGTLAARLVGAPIPQYSWRFHIGVMVPANLAVPPATQGGYLLWPMEFEPYLTTNYGEAPVVYPLGTATNSLNYNSNTMSFKASFWNGSASAQDMFTIQNVCGSGTNPNCKLTMGGGGSSGTHTIEMPSLTVPFINGIAMATDGDFLSIGDVTSTAMGTGSSAFANYAFQYATSSMVGGTALGFAGCNLDAANAHVTGGTYLDCFGANTRPLATGDTYEMMVGGNTIGHGTGTATYGPVNITNHYFNGTLHAGSAQLSGITGAVQCLQADTTGLVSGTTVPCGGLSSVNGNGGALVMNFSAGAGSCSYSSGTTTCTISGSGSGGGSVTNFTANTGNWPSWLVPSVATSTSTPDLSVAASPIPNSALASSSMTINSVSCALGSTCSIPTGSGSVSGLTTGQVGIAGSATTITSSKAIQGTDASLLSSGIISGTGSPLCTDANGGATTSGCPAGTTGLSGMTAAQVPIAATATTVTSSKALAGSGAAISTGPSSAVSGHVPTFTGSAGQLADSGTFLSSLLTSAVTSINGNSTAAQTINNTDGNIGVSSSGGTTTLSYSGPGSGTGTNPTVKFPPTAYATLVGTYPCNSGNEGTVAEINDSTVSTWGTAITVGGGSNKVLAHCNGTNYTVMGN